MCLKIMKTMKKKIGPSKAGMYVSLIYKLHVVKKNIPFNNGPQIWP